MRTATIKISSRKLATFLLLASCVFSLNIAEAAPIAPGFQLEGLAEAGRPAIKFRENLNNNSLQGTISSWYSNLFYVGRSENGVTYDLVASNQGNFSYLANSGRNYFGKDGNFLLAARLGPAGRLLGGRLKITGRIRGIGITNSKKVLVRAKVTGIVSRGRTVGFAIENIRCAEQIDNCQENPLVKESIYMRLRQQFPGIRTLGDQRFLTGIQANITTVPVPASIWLMVSGLGLLGARAARKKRQQTA